MKRIGLHWLVFVALLLSCEERIDKSMEGNTLKVLAVEGVITNELVNHLIRLSVAHSDLNGDRIPAVGARVFLREGNSITAIELTESPTQSGNYYTPTMRAVFGRKYTLTISYNGQTYTAQDQSIAVDALPIFTYEKASTTDNTFRITSGAGGNVPNYVSHYVDWKGTSTCTIGQSCEALLVSYDLKNLDANDIFKPGKEDVVFPAGSTVYRKKYSVSPAYQAFLRSMLSETEWKGSVFDVDRSNAATNLSEGAVGFFAVSTVVADTIVVN
jgi:hypothetical protein